jgi:hypothetical protein
MTDSLPPPYGFSASPTDLVPRSTAHALWTAGLLEAGFLAAMRGEWNGPNEQPAGLPAVADLISGFLPRRHDMDTVPGDLQWIGVFLDHPQTTWSTCVTGLAPALLDKNIRPLLGQLIDLPHSPGAKGVLAGVRFPTTDQKIPDTWLGHLLGGTLKAKNVASQLEWAKNEGLDVSDPDLRGLWKKALGDGRRSLREPGGVIGFLVEENAFLDPTEVFDVLQPLEKLIPSGRNTPDDAYWGDIPWAKLEDFLVQKTMGTTHLPAMAPRWTDLRARFDMQGARAFAHTMEQMGVVVGPPRAIFLDRMEELLTSVLYKNQGAFASDTLFGLARTWMAWEKDTPHPPSLSEEETDRLACITLMLGHRIGQPDMAALFDHFLPDRDERTHRAMVVLSHGATKVVSIDRLARWARGTGSQILPALAPDVRQDTLTLLIDLLVAGKQPLVPFFEVWWETPEKQTAWMEGMDGFALNRCVFDTAPNVHLLSRMEVMVGEHGLRMPQDLGESRWMKEWQADKRTDRGMRFERLCLAGQLPARRANPVRRL